MSTTLTNYDLLRLGHVKRWHNVNTIRQQTVAEHSYMVTLIALILFDRIVGREDVPMMMSVAMCGMFHDAPEVVTGDPPTPAKRFMREFTGDPDLFKKMDGILMPVVPFQGKPMHDSIAPFVKMADAIEGAHWISENGAGRHAEIVAAAGWRRVEDLVEKLDNEEPTAGWYEAVNEVLMALGMRYVHKQSRITPP